MNTSHKIFLAMVLALAAFASAACGGSTAPAPTAATTIPAAPSSPSAVPPSPTVAAPYAATATTAPSATNQPTIQATSTAATLESGGSSDQTATPEESQPTTIAATSVSSGGTYDGDWQGFTSKGDPLSFHVENNQITEMLINYSYVVGACSGGAGSLQPVENATIQGDNFTAITTDSDNQVYTLIGKFASPTQAAGSQEVAGKAPNCNDAAFDARDTWTAVNTTVMGTPTPPAPLPTETPNAENLNDPSNYVVGLFLGADMQQLDSFVKYIDDQVTFSFGATKGEGNTKLKAYLEGLVNAGAQFELAGPPTTSVNVAKFSLKVVGGAAPTTYQNCSLTIGNQKVTDVTCK